MSSDDLLLAAKNGNCAELRRIIDLSLTNADYNGALVSAAFKGHWECIGMLLPLSDRTAKNRALYVASAGNHLACCDALFPHTNKTGRTSALNAGVRLNENATQIVSYFLGKGVTDPHGKALIEAAVRGYDDAVRMLIPVSKPMAHNSSALRHAVYHGHKECAQALFAASDPHTVWKHLHAFRSDASQQWPILDDLFAQQQHNTLTDSLGVNLKPGRSRKL